MTEVSLKDGEIKLFEHQMAVSNRNCMALWGFGFLVLMVASYLMASYTIMLLAVGFVLVALAAVQEIKRQMYPIGLIAVMQLQRGQKTSN